MAKAVLREGGAKPAILNAANEIAVAAFLEGSIGFLDIASISAEALERCAPAAPASIEEVLDIDRDARAVAKGVTQRYSR
jgi:1-deoxy-D-xylulose-5-phosphate reductoisomerase